MTSQKFQRTWNNLMSFRISELWCVEALKKIRSISSANALITAYKSDKILPKVIYPLFFWLVSNIKLFLLLFILLNKKKLKEKIIKWNFFHIKMHIKLFFLNFNSTDFPAILKSFYLNCFIVGKLKLKLKLIWRFD